MTTVSTLISTSVNDARITLINILESNPQHAALLSLQLLERLQHAEGQASRHTVVLRTLRAAAKRIAEADTPDHQGPDLANLYYTLPVGDLRKVLAGSPNSHQHRAESILTTLLSIRGEVKCDSRRKLLLTALGKSAKALAEGQGRAVA